MYVYDSSRTGQTNKRLSVAYQLKKAESHPGSYDSVTLFFNSNRASYVSYSVESKYTSLANGQKATSGTLVFNFYDKIASTNVSYATVEVKRTSSSRLDYGATWIHSYTETNVNVSLNPGISFGGVGLVSGSVGVSINFSSNEKTWSLSDTGYYS